MKSISTRVKKEPLKSSTIMQKNKLGVINNNQKQNSARLQTKTLPSANKITKTLTWKNNQKIDPSATYPNNLQNNNKISKGNSPTNTNAIIKKPLQKLQSGSIMHSNTNTSPLRSIYKRPSTSLSNHNKILLNEDMPFSKDIFLKNILTLLDNFKPSLTSKSNGLIEDNPPLITFDILTKQLNLINSNDQFSNSNKRKATYITFFDFLFQLLEDIKVLCNQDIIIPKAITNEQTTQNHLCDINESQLQERSNIIEPIGQNNKEGLIEECIQSMLISSIYSDFYQDIIQCSPLDNEQKMKMMKNGNEEDKLQSKLMTKKISLSGVIRENMALTKHLKETQERIMNKHRRNDNRPMIIQQKTSHPSHDSTIKMNDNDTENDNEYYYIEENVNEDCNMQTFPRSHKKPENRHKHTMSIPEPIKKDDDKCIII